MRAVFKALPSASLILLPDPPKFTIVDVNRAYLTATETKEDNLIDKGLFEAFPENPDDGDGTGVTNLKASLEHVLAAKEPHKMEVQRYDIPIRGSHEFEEKYWCSENIPVMNRQGEVAFIIHSANDVTERVLSEKKAKMVTNELLETEEHYRSLFEHNPDAVYSFDLEGTFLSANKAVAKLAETSVDELLNITFVPFIAGEDKQRVTNHFQRATEGEVQHYECDIVTAKGNRRTIKVTNMPIIVDGEIVGVYGIAKNITEKKAAERLLDKAYQLARIGTWEFDMLTHELHWSPVTKQVHGFGPDYQPDVESTIALFKEGIHRETFARAARDAIEHEVPFDVELKIISGQGDERWIRAAGKPEYKDGVCTRFYGISQNVTDRRKAQEDLQLSEQRFKALVQGGSDLIAILDSEGNYTYVSPTSETVLGIPAENFIGTNVLTYIHEDDKSRIKETLSELGDNRHTHISPFRFRNAQGNWRWIETTLTNMIENPAIGGFVANSRDVTEKVEGETRLQESLERYDIVSQATSDTIWDLDLKKDLMQYNRNIYTMFGYKKAEVKEPGRWWRSKIHPDDLQHVRSSLDKAVKQRRDRFQLEYRFQCADGSYKHIYDRAFLVTDDENNPVRMTGAMQDVTSQKEEEERLKLLESVITNTTESVIITEAKPRDVLDRKILYVNNAFSDLTGYTGSEVVGKPLRLLSNPAVDADDPMRIKLRKAMQKAQPVEVEFVDYKRCGEEFWINVSAVPVKNTKGEVSHWITIGRDVTERRNHEEEIQKSLKEKETLLAEIHHRVKNNLAVVSAMMQLQMFDEESTAVREKLFSSVARIQTMATIHEQLYQSGSFADMDFAQNLQKLVSGIIDTVRFTSPIELDLHLQPVQLNVNQAIPCSLIVNEVVTNTLKHAFNGSGKGKIVVKLSESDNKIDLMISDNGTGLPEDFNKTANGNSLGLHLIQVLSRQLEAEECYSSSGKGTCFNLRFEKSEIKGIGSAHLL